MTNCDCKYLVHVGKDLNGNRIMYNPLKHTIMECLSISMGYVCQQRNEGWPCCFRKHIVPKETHWSTLDECTKNAKCKVCPPAK